MKKRRRLLSARNVPSIVLSPASRPRLSHSIVDSYNTPVPHERYVANTRPRLSPGADCLYCLPKHQTQSCFLCPAARVLDLKPPRCNSKAPSAAHSQTIRRDWLQKDNATALSSAEIERNTHSKEPKLVDVSPVLVTRKLNRPFASVGVCGVFPSRLDAFLEEVVVCLLRKLGWRDDVVVQTGRRMSNQGR